MAYTITRDSDVAVADFISLDPFNPNTNTTVVEPLSRPNVAGIGFRKLARKAAPYTLRGFRNFKNVFSARSSINNLRSEIVGELVTVSLDGQVFSRLMVLEVRELLARAVANTTTGLSISTSGLWGANTGSSTAPGIGMMEIIVVYVGPIPDP